MYGMTIMYTSQPRIGTAVMKFSIPITTEKMMKDDDEYQSAQPVVQVLILDQIPHPFTSFL